MYPGGWLESILGACMWGMKRHGEIKAKSTIGSPYLKKNKEQHLDMHGYHINVGTSSKY